MIELLKKAFIEGYKQRAEGSNLIFDETSEMYAEHIFEKWIKGQTLLIDSEETLLKDLKEQLTLTDAVKSGSERLKIPKTTKEQRVQLNEGL